MEKNYSSEKILIVIALVLLSGIIFYNAFFVPEVSTPSIIYVDKDQTEIQSDSEEKSSSESSDSSETNSEKVNINTAPAEEIADKLPRIGEKIAEKIIEYREYNGGFSSIDEIKNVSGIGDKIFENIKDLICV